ncbi:hypothetical protein TcBrA4_0121680 [Trypanosoma cruzi]|nr:hypothetical protein TcBrA4_0121680 [Trypanosoma cruzi]
MTIKQSLGFIDRRVLQEETASSLNDVLVPLSRVLNGSFECGHCKRLRLKIARLESELASARAREKKTERDAAACPISRFG